LANLFSALLASLVFRAEVVENPDFVEEKGLVGIFSSWRPAGRKLRVDVFAP
jgi:hypothetical protein